MFSKTKRILLSNNWGHPCAAVLTLAGLGLIFWVSITVWQRPCHAQEGFTFISNTECPSFLSDLEPGFIALCFWIIGLTAWLTGQRRIITGFFMITAAAMITGKLSAMGSDYGGRLFYLSLAWLSPITFHFHVILLDRSLRCIERVLLTVLYAIGPLYSIPFILWTISTLQQQTWFDALRTSIRLTLILALTLTALLLFQDYRRRASLAAHRQIRLIAFGDLTAVMPLLLLSLLPDTLGMQSHVPYELSFLCLLISPLTYAYSLYRHRLVWAEAGFNRTAVYFLLFTLLLSVYLAAGIAVNRLTGIPADYWPIVGALSVVLLFLFTRLQRGIQRLTSWALYGNEISFFSMVEHLAETLSRTLDREMLRHLLIGELAPAMRISKSAVYLRDEDNTLGLLGAVGFESASLGNHRLPGDGHLAAYLESLAKPVGCACVRQAMAEAPLSLAESALLSLTGIELWLPLVSSGVLQGLLLLGSRPRGDFFTPEDERILTTLACQSGIAAYNVRLTEQFRAGRQELARAHQQLLVGREQERRRLAHDLHDDVVQQLIGISYQLAGLRRTAHDGQYGAGLYAAAAPGLIQTEVLSVVVRLRQLIGELLPAGLEEFGLTPALEGYIARLQREGGPELPEIEADLDPSGTALTSPVAICLFRAAQEAMRNSLKHAQAHCIRLCLRLYPDEVVLSVRDDGCGFSVPLRLSELAQANHFGLLGIAERVTWSGGQFVVNSGPGMGTEVITRIPLNGRSTTYDRDHSSTVGR